MKRPKNITPTREVIPQPGIPLSEAVQIWIADGQAQGFSKRTLTDRAGMFRRIEWWLVHEERVQPELSALTVERIRRFLAYCREPRPEGRFGCENAVAKRAAKPATVHTYFRDLHAFCRFCVAEALLDSDPMLNIKAPRLPKDQIRPFEAEQIQALLNAASATSAPHRNRAVLLVLLDTGLRVSELCSLKVGDVSRSGSEIVVRGKGGKQRSIYLGTLARRAVRRYLLQERARASEDEPLFLSERGRSAGTALTPNGVRLMMRECGRLAGIEGVRCSPHTLRHTFAISFLRGGGNLLALQRLMGHEDLTVLRRYVALADRDLAEAHRIASPVDRMRVR